VQWSQRDRLWARAVAVLLALGVLALPWLSSRVPSEWLPAAAVQVLLVAAAIAVALALLAAARRPHPARIAAAFGGGAALVFLVLAGGFLPAFREAQPNRAVAEDVARERSFRADAGFALCRDPARVQRDLLFADRVIAEDRCDLWSLAASRHPYLMLLGDAETRSLLRLPNVRPIAPYRALPATALTLSGLVTGLEPEPLALVANFETEDPVAEVKRKKDRKRALKEDAPE
jgi:hypothetical protein